MKSIFMRVLFCKIHCPSFICFCKPSVATHLYNPGPLNFENTHHAPTSSTVSDASDHNNNNNISPCVEEESTEVKDDEILEVEKEEDVLRSCVKNKGISQIQSVERKKVHWRDSLGKELVDTKEFESSEPGDSENEEDGRGCLCSIL